MPPGVPEIKEQFLLVLQVRLNLHLHQFILFVLDKDSLGQISHSLATSQWGDNLAIQKDDQGQKTLQ